MPLKDEVRLVLFLLGGEKCAWCGVPIRFADMEIDHIIPKSLAGDELRDALNLHGLPEEFELDSVRNLVPSCRKCNGDKQARVPPDRPIITMMLESAAGRERTVLEEAKAEITRRDLSVAIAKVEIAAKNRAGDPAIEELLGSLEKVLKDAESSQGKADDLVAVAIHPAMSLLWGSTDRWKLVRSSGPDVAVVSDGKQVGTTGTHITYQCSHCRSYGPWDGIRCLTCGNREAPE
jgi:HNH endonuclease